jgi:hypothetical protein
MGVFRIVVDGRTRRRNQRISVGWAAQLALTASLPAGTNSGEKEGSFIVLMFVIIG